MPYLSRAFQCKKNFSVDNCEGFAISFEGIPEVVNFSDDSFGRVAHIVEGFSGVEFCNVDNEQVNCIIVKNTGVRSVKGMSMLDSSK